MERSLLAGAALVFTAIAGPCQVASSSRRQAAAEAMLAAQRSLIVDRDAAVAKAGFLAAIQTDPTFASPRFNLGVLAEASEDWSGAAKWFAEYLLLDSTSAWAARARAELSRTTHLTLARGDSSSTQQAEYQRHIMLGRRLVAAAMFDDALAEAARAHAARPRGWESYALASSALAPTGRYLRALAMLDTAILYAPATAVGSLRTSKGLLERTRVARVP